MNTYYEFTTVNQNDSLYPEKLKALANPPEEITFAGTLPTNDVPTVAIIGARLCSSYGRYVARQYAQTLAEQGIQIINGMSLGVDGIALRAGLSGGMDCFGVLGSGADVCYPPENMELYGDLKEHGGIISEQPIGTQPKPDNSSQRNRIIAALADAILVIESRKKSGTLVTVGIAQELGKKIYAVPGRVTDRLSDGANELLKMGAVMAIDPEEVADQIWADFRKEANNSEDYN